MDKIQQLQKELEKAKREDLYKRWESYLDKVRDFCESIKGKTLITWTMNGRFVIYKVDDYIEQYYADREGFRGDWSPKRWIELKSHGFLNCHVPDSDGKWYNPEITNQNHSNFTFYSINTNRKKRLQELHISKIEFNKESINKSCWGDINTATKIGYTEYDKYSEDPNYDRSLEPFLMCSFVVPNELWDEAWEIYKIQVESTMKWWNKYETTIKEAPRVTFK